MSRSEAWLLVGAYNAEGEAGIHRFRFDLATGTLVPAGPGMVTRCPSYLALHPDGRHVYAVNERDGGREGNVSAFALDGVSGRVAFLNEQSSRGQAPCHLCVEANGRHLVVANYQSGSVAVLPILADGRLGEASQVVAHSGRGPHPSRQQGPHAHFAVWTVDGRRVLVCDLGIDRVLGYAWDAAAGRLVGDPAAGMALPSGSGPRHLAFGAGGRHLYVLNELGSTVAVFAAAGACWEPQGLVSTLPPGVSGRSTGAAIRIHPRGRFLYASNRGHDSIAVLALAGTGQPSLVGWVPSGGACPRDIQLDPSGTWLLAANQVSGTVTVFRVEDEGSRLVPGGTAAEVPGAAGLLLAPVAEA